MIVARTYTVTFAASAQAGAIDFFEAICGASVALVLLALRIANLTEVGDAAEEQINWYIKRGAGTYASGSGGNTGVTRNPARPGDSAASFTAETLNTTRIAVGTGTLATLHEDGFNVRGGLAETWTPETAHGCGPSQALAIGLTSAPADSITWVGTAYFGEVAP